MSVLMDSRGKLLRLIQEAEKVDTAYGTAKMLYEQLDSGDPVNTAGLGMNLVFADGSTVPVPLPTDQAALLEHTARAVNFLGGDIVRIWHDIAAVANEAKLYCDKATASLEDQTQAQLGQMPGQQTTGQQQPQPRVRQVPTTTTPV